jgi:predicted amidohydrolase
MRDVTVAVVQMKPILNEMENNLVQISDWIKKIATAQKTDLIIFPELCTTGYECGVRFTELAQRVPGPTVNLVAQRASEFGVHVAFGMASKEKVESILFDSAVVVGSDGDLIGEYRKVHLKGEEKLAFRNGWKFPVFETEFGNIGLMLGWDLAFPEAARTYALDGADLLVVMANWEQPYNEEWRTYLLARAYENTCFIAAANRIGQDATYSFFGESMIISPRGQIYASVDQEVEGYAVARIDLDEVRKYREEFQTLQCRQPSAYRSIVRAY